MLRLQPKGSSKDVSVLRTESSTDANSALCAVGMFCVRVSEGGLSPRALRLFAFLTTRLRRRSVFGSRNVFNPMTDFMATEGGDEDAQFAAHLLDHLFRREVRAVVQLKRKEAAARDVTAWPNGEPQPLVDFDGTDLPRACDAASRDMETVKQIWDLSMQVRTFLSASDELRGSRKALGALKFDKDDDTMMQWVSCASNLRAHCFNIALKSLFDIKGGLFLLRPTAWRQGRTRQQEVIVCTGIAGNIIPAIAATNAIVSGLMVQQALLYLRSGVDACKSVGGHDVVLCSWA